MGVESTYAQRVGLAIALIALKSTASSKPANGVTKRRSRPSLPHEIHYIVNIAQVGEMKKRTFLLYTQQLSGTESLTGTSVTYGRYPYIGMGRTKCQSGKSPTIRQGGRGGKVGEGSTIVSRVEAAPPEQKRLTSSNRNKKVDQNNP
ncbi:hypothetical protein Syun_018763 [Stephania yunnanensis]|uniref:Uncharacterized protein n=1 Tax=Stephania yunnanensis TaxID=152371 RepID=A0AAP0ISW4_9MAGN